MNLWCLASERESCSGRPERVRLGHLERLRLERGSYGESEFGPPSGSEIGPS